MDQKKNMPEYNLREREREKLLTSGREALWSRLSFLILFVFRVGFYFFN